MLEDAVSRQELDAELFKVFIDAHIYDLPRRIV